MGKIELLSLGIDAMVLIIIGAFLRVFVSKINDCISKPIFEVYKEMLEYRIHELEKEVHSLREDFRAIHSK